MKSASISTRAVARVAGPWLIATLLLFPTIAALGDGTDDGCGMAESCLVMSPLPDSSSSAVVRRTSRDHGSSARAPDRRASQKARGAKKKPNAYGLSSQGKGVEVNGANDPFSGYYPAK